MRTTLGKRGAPPLAVALLVCLGCAGLVANTPPSPTGYRYFGLPGSGDAWSAKIGAWQARERATEAAPSVAAPPLVPGAPAGGLQGKYESFRSDRKRATAREFAAWIQLQAKDHYRADGPVDHWATLAETLQRDGDDCDGLELLTYNGLLELGFESNEVFRAIVYRPSDGQHHMVTLWFEDADDPWVLDPTGAMTEGMPRMSDRPAWIPLKVFGESVEYTVRPATLPRSLVSN